MFSKDKLVFDPSVADDTDNVGAYLRSSDGTLLTHTDVSGKKALDVNVANEVDIRALAFATDSVDVSGSSVSIAGDVNVTQGTDPWVVSATDLDIRNLSAAQDNVAIIGISDGTNSLAINPDGSLNVNADISVVNGSDKAEDSAHTSGDIGTYVLAVREDTLGVTTSASGDYGSFKTNDKGALWVKHDGAISTTVNGHTSWLVTQNTVNTTAELVVAADLTNRKKILIQNVSTKIVYLGHSASVTDANGMRLAANGSVELEIAAGVAIYAIANAAGADLRIAELAA